MRKSHNLQGAVFHIYMENTPVGDITLVQQDERIARLSMGRRPAGECRETTLMKECERQLWEYFKGKRRAFDLPVYARGTSFQQKVWTALSQIPYGETATYGDIAEHIGCSGAARAVGSACGANPMLIIVPCHRAVGKNGLCGYAGGVVSKRILLKIEKSWK